VEAAVTGGSVLGGGGGGSAAEGRRLGRLALGRGSPELVDLEELDPGDLLVTVSAVGAPSAREAFVAPEHYCRAVTELGRAAGIEVAGLITNENGGLATVNGWLQSAALGIPVVDAPCNGRAHPTGAMGSLGLNRDPSYESWQVAVGGSAENGRFVQVVARGSLERVAAIVRQSAVQAGGLVAVARNPVKVDRVRRHGAPGAIGQAIRVGRAMLEASPRGGPAVAEACAAELGGRLLCQGRIATVELVSEGGFDSGRVVVDAGEGVRYLLTFWNEYMTAESDEDVVARFPDLVATLDARTGLALPTAEVEEGVEVFVLVVDRSRLILSTTMDDPELLEPVEKVIGRKITP